MSRRQRPSYEHAAESEREAVTLASIAPFGPQFFVRHLRAFARDRCPDPGEALPAVTLCLTSGEALDVCHVIGLSPAWVALAVHDDEHPSGVPAMRTELVPYEAIMRVTIRATRLRSPHVGFDHAHAPQMIEEPPSHEARVAEDMLRTAAVPPAPAGGGATP